MVIQWQFHWGFHGHIGHCPMIYGDYLGIKHEKLLKWKPCLCLAV